MALSPKIKLSLSNNGGTATITDITGLYNASTNTGGWTTPNINGSNVTAATLAITPSGASVQTVNVLSQIPASVTGTFAFNPITITDYSDGLATVLYTLTTASTSYTYTLTTLFSCSARACIDAMWLKVSKEACGSCCGLNEVIDNANMAEGLYKSLTSAASCGNTACVTKILSAITSLCDFEDCGCD